MWKEGHCQVPTVELISEFLDILRSTGKVCWATGDSLQCGDELKYSHGENTCYRITSSGKMSYGSMDVYIDFAWKNYTKCTFHGCRVPDEGLTMEPASDEDIMKLFL